MDDSGSDHRSIVCLGKEKEPHEETGGQRTKGSGHEHSDAADGERIEASKRRAKS